MGRLGTSELRELGYFQDSNIARPEQQGVIGTKTPGEIADDKQPKDSLISRKLREARGKTDDKDRDKGREMED